MHFCTIARRLLAGTTLFLAAAAAPALAQTTSSVVVTLTGPAGGINVGAANDFEAVIRNDGPDVATNVVLTLTAAAPFLVEGFSGGGCLPSTTNPNVCTIPSLAVGAANEVTVVASLSYPVPDPYPTDAASCVTGTVGEVSGSVVADNDTSAATSAIASSVVNLFTDIQVTVTPDSQSIDSGGTQHMRVVVTNVGPCAAGAVTAEFAFPTALGFESAVDGTPAFCAAVPLDASPGDDTVTPAIPPGAFTDFGCDMGAMALGETRAFDVVMRLAKLPDDLTKAVYPFGVTATPDVHDAIAGNNTGTAPNRYENDSGCSTGGAGTLFGLLSLVALRFGRRRSS